MHLYVYYEVPHAEAARALAAVRSVQKRLADEHAAQGRLLRRIDRSKPHETWMEIYENIDDTFEAHLTRAFNESDARDLITGLRHFERFTDFD